MATRDLLTELDGDSNLLNLALEETSEVSNIESENVVEVVMIQNIYTV